MTKYAIGIIRTSVETRIVEAIDNEMAIRVAQNFGGYPKVSREETKVIYVKILDKGEFNASRKKV